MKVSRTLALISWLCVVPLVVSAHAQLMQVAELTAPDGVPNDFFGTSVALAGNTAVVSTSNVPKLHRGVYVFSNAGGTWAQVAELTTSDGNKNLVFGTHVAISSDGGTVAVTAPGIQARDGAVYVFVKLPSGWTNMRETAKLTVDSRIPAFASNVAVSRDGSKVVALSNGFGGFIFVRPPSGWVSMTKETATLEVASGASTGVAISGDTVALADPGFNGFGMGAILVYVLGPGSHMPVIQPTATLTGSDQACSSLGASVAIEGDTIVTGAPVASPGWVCVFVKPPSGWVNMTQNAELGLSASQGGVVGASVAISDHMIVTGAPGALADFQGVFYGYAEPPGGWVNTTTPNLEGTSQDGAEFDDFGFSIAISGKTVLVGAPLHAVNGNTAQGATYVFSPQ